MTSKFCKTCLLDKPLTDYALDNNAKDGHRIHCKSCINDRKKLLRKSDPEKFRQYTRKYLNDKPERKLLNSAQQRAKVKNLEFNITIDDVLIPDCCPILGVKLITNSNINGGENYSASIDRIDPIKGYVRGNIMIMSRLANMMKSTATDDQLLTFADWIINNIKK